MKYIKFIDLNHKKSFMIYVVLIGSMFIPFYATYTTSSYNWLDSFFEYIVYRETQAVIGIGITCLSILFMLVNIVGNRGSKTIRKNSLIINIIGTIILLSLAVFGENIYNISYTYYTMEIGAYCLAALAGASTYYYYLAIKNIDNIIIKKEIRIENNENIQQQNSEKENIWYCSNCGKKYTKGNFCEVCGTKRNNVE